jgi:hypothetical protein
VWPLRGISIKGDLSTKGGLSLELSSREASHGTLHKGGPLKVASVKVGLSWESSLRVTSHWSLHKGDLAWELPLRGASQESLH